MLIIWRNTPDIVLFFLHTCCRELCVRHPLTTVNAQFSFNSLLFFYLQYLQLSGPAHLDVSVLDLQVLCRKV